MNLLKEKVKFVVPAPSPVAGRWRVTVQELLKEDAQKIEIYQASELIFDTRHSASMTELFTPKRFDVTLEGGTYTSDAPMRQERHNETSCPPKMKSDDGHMKYQSQQYYADIQDQMQDTRTKMPA